MLFAFSFFFFVIVCEMEFNNNNSFNPNMNSYFTSTPLDSDNSNPTFYNMTQPNIPGWTYPNQYNPYPHSYDYNFQNNFNSSQSQWGFTSRELNFQPPCPPCSPCRQFTQYSFPDFASYTPFSGPPIEEKSGVRKEYRSQSTRGQATTS